MPGADKYVLNPQASQVIIYVYRTGRMARLGHNHVIRVGQLEGELWRAERLAQSRVEVRVPVRGLVVDDAALRAAAGPEFDTRPSREDIEGTRRNLLGPQVLDAAAHPWVVVKGTPAAVRTPDMELDAAITIRGQTLRLRIPVRLESMPNQVLASGEFGLRQSDFGITPFSVMMGALPVQDEVRVAFRLVAERED